MEALLIGQFEKFLLILARISGIFFITPFWGSAIIPVKVKSALTLFISLVVFPIVNPYLNFPIPEDAISYGLLIGGQVLIGLAIGFFAYIVISAFQMSGEFYSITMGFGIANVFDPLSHIEQPLIGQLLTLFALLAFIVIGGPHMVVIAICKSFESLPAINLNATGILAQSCIHTFVIIFMTACKIAMPIIGILFLVTIAMALLSKAAPMINIMIVGFPITIVVGLITLIIMFPLLYGVVDNLFDQWMIDSSKLMFLLGKK